MAVIAHRGRSARALIVLWFVRIVMKTVFRVFPMSDRTLPILRADFRAIVAIEARYRATGGLDARERADLDQRLNALSARIRYQANDGNANWRPISINERQARLNARIDAGVRSGQISPVEAVRLRTEFLALARLEDTYRATGGLTAWERQDLERRFDALATRIRFERRDWWQF